jgi:CheY-like chemotaxis protein/signal transduction histidine kinase
MGLLHKITRYFLQKVDQNLDLDNKSKIVTISFVAIVSTCFFLSFGIIALINDNFLLALVLGLASGINYVVYIFLYRTYKAELFSTLVLLNISLVFLYCLVTGGAFQTGFLWIFPFPILAVALKGLEGGTRASGIFLVFIILTCVLNLYVPALPDYELTFSLRLIGAYIAIHAMIYTYEFLSVNDQHTMESWISESRKESKRKDDFLSKLSHQIRTPLNNITLISNLVDRTKLPSDQQDLFDTIIASTNNLVNVVNNIVQISALDIDDKEQVPLSFNVESTIENTLRLFKNQHRDKITIESKIETARTNYFGNPVRIKQLILNLIENIIKIDFDEKYTIVLNTRITREADDFSKMDIEITCPKVSVKKDDKDNYFVSTGKPVTDNEDLQKNYLDFGITHKIVALYQGGFDLTVKDELTYIKVSLLLKNDNKVVAKQRVTSQEAEDIITSSRNQRLEDANVLLVEDNSINQKIVILSLKNKIKNIEVANNGKEALDKFGTTKYDLILMDIQMPVMNGIVATRKIRELEASTNTHTPIIAITANALSGDKEACLAAGMNEYISKPFQVEILLQKMQNLLSQNS